MTLTTLLIILLVVMLLGGGMAHGTYGWAGWSPAGIVILVLLFMLLTGRL
jgi:hypothetical protein